MVRRTGRESNHEGHCGLKGVAAILCCFLPLVSTGCGLNGAGITVVETIAAKGATVIRARSYGLHVNTGTNDAGASLGIAETTAVYPETGVPEGEREDGWFRMKSPWPDVEPILVQRRVVGVDIGLNRLKIGVTVGDSEKTVLARVPADRSVVRRVLFMPGFPELTELAICEEDPRCYENP